MHAVLSRSASQSAVSCSGCSASSGHPYCHAPAASCRLRFGLLAAETWFIWTKFARNTAQNGGAVLLEGGTPEAFFVNCTWDVSFVPFCPAAGLRVH